MNRLIRIEAKKCRQGEGFSTCLAFFATVILPLCLFCFAFFLLMGGFAFPFFQRLLEVMPISLWLAVLTICLAVSFFCFSRGEMYFYKKAFSRADLKGTSVGLTALTAIEFFVSALILAVCEIPAALIFAVLKGFLLFSMPLLATSALFCCFVSAVTVGLWYYRRISNLLFLTKYIFISNRNLSALQCMKKSTQAMLSRENEFEKLRVGFLPSLLLCVLVVPIPIVWGNYKQAMAIAARDFLKDGI